MSPNNATKVIKTTSTMYEIQMNEKMAELEKWNVLTQAQLTDGKEMMDEIGDDDNLLRFKQEYQKLMRVTQQILKKANLMRGKYEDVAKEIELIDVQPVDTGKIGADAVTVKTLKNQILRAENLYSLSTRREESSKLEIRQLRLEISNLTTTIKQGVGLSASQERAINDLIAQKEQSTKDLEAQLEKIVFFRNSLTTISEKIEGLEIERKNIDKEIQLLKEKNAAKKIEIDLEIKNKEKLERELRELRVIVTIKSQEAVSKQSAVNRATEEIALIEAQIKQQKTLIEKLLKDQESLGSRTVKLQQDYDEQMGLTHELLSENEIALLEFKMKEKELANHKAEVKKVMRIKEVLVKKSRLLEEEKVQAEMERKIYRTQNDAILHECDKVKRIVDGVKKNIDDLNREKDILDACLKKTQIESTNLNSLLLLQKQQNAMIEIEKARMVKEITENQKQKILLEDERDSFIKQYQDLNDQANQGMNELKEIELKIFEFKKQTFQAENKLKYQQNLYEAVQSDRKLHSKRLIESQAEINEMKRRLKIMNFQINGFKEDVNSKDAQLVKETNEYNKLVRDGELIVDEIKQLKGQNELAQTYIKSQMVEEFKLDQFVKEADVERGRQQNALNLIVTERDNLSSQLLRRNNELTVVYDKIKTQSLALLRGEVHYRDVIKHQQTLKEEILKIKVKLATMSNDNSAIPSMKRQIVKLQSQIIESQTKIKALEQELENPINVHRWRKLEGSQPQAFDFLQLQHTLQKKLIAKNKEEMEKASAIEVKEKLYLHLKTILAKQAGPEAIQQIAEFQKILKEKSGQLKHMETELNMYQAQVNEYKYTIEQLDKGLLDFKKKFLKMYKEKVGSSQGRSEDDNGIQPFEDNLEVVMPDISEVDESLVENQIEEVQEDPELEEFLRREERENQLRREVQAMDPEKSDIDEILSVSINDNVSKKGSQMDSSIASGVGAESSKVDSDSGKNDGSMKFDSTSSEKHGSDSSQKASDNNNGSDSSQKPSDNNDSISSQKHDEIDNLPALPQ